MSLRHILTFTREPVDCDLAGVYCPVSRPCNLCNEYFNSLPLLERMSREIPRRISLLREYGRGAFWRGSATREEVLAGRLKGLSWRISPPKGFLGRMKAAIFGYRRKS